MEPNQTESSGGNIMAIFAYLGILIIIPFLTDAKNNPFVKFHLKQGLVLVIAWFISMILSSMFYMGMWGIYNLLYLAIVVLSVIGIINVLTGKQKELPLMGQFAKHFKF